MNLKQIFCRHEFKAYTKYEAIQDYNTYRKFATNAIIPKFINVRKKSTCVKCGKEAKRHIKVNLIKDKK